MTPYEWELLLKTFTRLTEGIERIGPALEALSLPRSDAPQFLPGEPPPGPPPEIVNGQRRSTGWQYTSRHWLDLHPVCEVCGLEKAEEVHHKVPFHVDKSLELSNDNLMSVSRRCHFLWCHFGNWQRWNRRVDELAALFTEMRRER